MSPPPVSVETQTLALLKEIRDLLKSIASDAYTLKQDVSSIGGDVSRIEYKIPK